MPLLNPWPVLAARLPSGRIALGLGAFLALSGVFLQPSAPSQPPLRVPSNIAWTDETITTATSGDAVRGLVIARRCEHCHGREGFTTDPLVPNLAGIDRLVMWKQMNDFRAGKRQAIIMEAIANELSIRDYSDLAAYFSMLPTYADPGDPRSFPQSPPQSFHASIAARLVIAGDGQRGIPPCQACHGPIYRYRGAPSLMIQNAPYIQQQLDSFGDGMRHNDINMPMRTIASMLTAEEKQALAAYYGAGFANFPNNR